MGFTSALIGMAIAKTVGSVVSAKTQANAVRDATKMQVDATKQSADLQRDAWRQIQGYQAPYLNLGGNAANLLGSLTAAPNNPNAYRNVGAPPPMNYGAPPAPPPQAPAPPMPSRAAVPPWAQHIRDAGHDPWAFVSAMRPPNA